MACTCGEWGSAVYVFCRGEASLSGQPKLTFWTKRVTVACVEKWWGVVSAMLRTSQWCCVTLDTLELTCLGKPQ